MRLSIILSGWVFVETLNCIQGLLNSKGQYPRTPYRGRSLEKYLYESNLKTNSKRSAWDISNRFNKNSASNWNTLSSLNNQGMKLPLLDDSLESEDPILLTNSIQERRSIGDSDKRFNALNQNGILLPTVFGRQLLLKPFSKTGGVYDKKLNAYNNNRVILQSIPEFIEKNEKGSIKYFPEHERKEDSFVVDTNGGSLITAIRQHFKQEKYDSFSTTSNEYELPSTERATTTSISTEPSFGTENSIEVISSTLETEVPTFFTTLSYSFPTTPEIVQQETTEKATQPEQEITKSSIQSFTSEALDISTIFPTTQQPLTKYQALDLGRFEVTTNSGGNVKLMLTSSNTEASMVTSPEVMMTYQATSVTDETPLVVTEAIQISSLSQTEIDIPKVDDTEPVTENPIFEILEASSESVMARTSLESIPETSENIVSISLPDITTPTINVLPTGLDNGFVTTSESVDDAKPNIHIEHLDQLDLGEEFNTSKMLIEDAQHFDELVQTTELKDLRLETTTFNYELTTVVNVPIESPRSVRHLSHYAEFKNRTLDVPLRVDILDTQELIEKNYGNEKLVPSNFSKCSSVSELCTKHGDSNLRCFFHCATKIIDQDQQNLNISTQSEAADYNSLIYTMEKVIYSFCKPFDKPFFGFPHRSKIMPQSEPRWVNLFGGLEKINSLKHVSNLANSLPNIFVANQIGIYSKLKTVYTEVEDAISNNTETKRFRKGKIGSDCNLQTNDFLKAGLNLVEAISKSDFTLNLLLPGYMLMTAETGKSIFKNQKYYSAAKHGVSSMLNISCDDDLVKFARTGLRSQCQTDNISPKRSGNYCKMQIKYKYLYMYRNGTLASDQNNFRTLQHTVRS